MRFGLMLVAGMAVAGGPLFAQDCPAVARLQPAASLAGTLDATSCVLSDGSAYTPYRLDLPVRGTIRIELSDTSSDFSLTLRDTSGARLDGGTAIRRAVEAGSYAVLVGGKAPGGYKITTAFTAETAILCTNYPRIGTRQTVTGALGSYGCVAPDGTPYDAYTLTAAGSGTLTITATSTDFAPTVVLRGDDGRALAASVDGTLVTPVLGDSDYVVVVASADNGGSYQLTTTFENAAEDTCQPRKAFSDTASDTSRINADSCFVTVPESGDQRYYSYYNLSLSSPGTITLSAASADFTPTIYLLDEAGNTLAADTAGGGYDSSGQATSALRLRVPAGNYVAQSSAMFRLVARISSNMGTRQ